MKHPIKSAAYNARINAAGDTEPSIQVLRMKARLFPLALNELLDDSAS